MSLELINKYIFNPFSERFSWNYLFIYLLFIHINLRLELENIMGIWTLQIYLNQTANKVILLLIFRVGGDLRNHHYRLYVMNI
jgi:hypothetical protein